MWDAPRYLLGKHERDVRRQDQLLAQVRENEHPLRGRAERVVELQQDNAQGIDVLRTSLFRLRSHKNTHAHAQCGAYHALRVLASRCPLLGRRIAERATAGRVLLEHLALGVTGDHALAAGLSALVRILGAVVGVGVAHKYLALGESEVAQLHHSIAQEHVRGLQDTKRNNNHTSGKNSERKRMSTESCSYAL